MSTELTRTPLGCICNFKYGKTIRKVDIEKQGEYPVYSGYQIVGYSQQYTYKESQLIIVCRGAGGTGDIKVSPHHCSITNLSIVITVNPDIICKEYLYWVLINSDTYSLRTGSAQPQITIQSLEKLEVEIILDLTKQQKIIAILKSIDNKIELNQQMNKTLEEMAQAIFKCWFVDFEPVKAKMAQKEAREKGQTGESDESICNRLKLTSDILALFPDTLTDSPLGPIPEGWHVASIAEIAHVVMGQSPKGDTYNENKNGSLFFQGRAEFTTRFPKPRLYTTGPKRMAQKGDALISIRAPVGDLNMARNDCCIGRGLSAIRHNSGSASFTYYWIHSLQNTLKEYNGEGTVFGSINKKTLEGLETINPDPKLTQVYHDFISTLDDKIELLSSEINTLSQTRDTLLPKLLSGEISVDNIELEIE